MEVGNNELTEYRYWNMNDVVTRIWSLLPRGRWITLNTDYFGPLFSACDLLDIPLSVMQWLLVCAACGVADERRCRLRGRCYCPRAAPLQGPLGTVWRTYERVRLLRSDVEPQKVHQPRPTSDDACKLISSTPPTRQLVFHNTTLRRKAAVDFCTTTSRSAPLVLRCRLGLAPSLCTRTPCSWFMRAKPPTESTPTTFNKPTGPVVACP